MSGSSGLISTNYRQLAPDEIDRVAEECAEAWQDPNIPMRQYELAVKQELEGYRNGSPCAPYDALVKCMRRIPIKVLVAKPRFLDAGASSGYYSEVLKIAKFDVRYTGLDLSPAFKALAYKLYPSIDFTVGDSRSLCFHDDWFEIVLSSACLMHVREYEQVIQEAARVSQKYVIFHRTPIVADGPTAFFVKAAYQIPVLEIHFNEEELLALFAAHGLRAMFATDVFRQHDGFCHRTYLLEKQSGLNHIQV